MKQAVEGNETPSAREQRSEQTGHTPGPWRVAGHFITSNGPTIANCACSSMLPFDCEEQRANARLIAAAPDLLAAFKSMVAQYDGDDRDARYAPRRFAKEKAIIAKAEGK